MNEPEITALLDRLVEADLQPEDWDDVLRRSAVSGGRRRPIFRPGAALLGAVAVATALLVLGVTAPWRGGPTILDRAAAAILVPTPGQILSEHIVFRARVWHPYPQRSDAHIWIAGAPTHRFRVTLSGPLRAEIGGVVGGNSGLAYSFTSDVLDPVGFQYTITREVLDPTALIKQALTSGHAHVQGQTTIHGRKVIQIRLSWNAFGRLIPVADYFVDARTYRPFRIAIIPSSPESYRFGFPLSAAYSFLPSGLRWPGSVYDFVEYRTIAPTAANQRLTDIRAQHPNTPVI